MDEFIEVPFKTESYTDASNGGIETDQWSDSEIAGKIPKIESRITQVSSDKDDYFFFYAYGISKDKYKAYIESCKEAGFTEDLDEYETWFRAYDEEGYELYLTYNSDEETVNGYIDGRDL